MNPPIPKLTVEKSPVYCVLPFLGQKSVSIRNKISRLITNSYPQVSLRVIFRPSNTIGQWFKYKDCIPDALQSSVVYEYKCSRCNATYIGQTKRQLTVRIAEHQGKSYRTGLPISKPSFSAIRNCCEASGHKINKNDFSVLFAANDDTTRLLAESLLIRDRQPTLCTHESSTPLLCY